MRIALFIDAGIRDLSSEICIPALRNLIVRLAEFFDVTVYSLGLPDNLNDEYRCGKARVTFVGARYDDHPVRRIVAFRKAFANDHRRAAFEVVHGVRGFPCGFAAVVLGKLYRIPSIVSLQGGEAAAIPQIRYGHMLHQPLRSVTSWTCNTATALTTLTRFQEEAIGSFGIHRKHVYVIPYGADVIMFREAKNKTSTPPFHFLHVANLNEVKNQQTLLRGFAIVANRFDARLRIIGSGQLQGRLQQFAKDLSITDKVEFLGFVPYTRLPEQYQWGHILLHTSLYEGQGVVIAEAAAAGAAICGTRVGLIADLGEAAAASVPVGDYNGLAERVCELLGDPFRLDAMRERALSWANVHSVDWTANQFGGLYRSVVRMNSSNPTVSA